MVYPYTIIKYPNRIDKNASGWSVSGEYFNVPASSPYTDYLDHIPYGTATTFIYASGGAAYTQTLSSTPGAGEFYMDYSVGKVKFNSSDATAAVEARYITLGDDIMALHVNNMQDEVYGIETNMGRGINGSFVDLSTRLNYMTLYPSVHASGVNATVQYNSNGYFAGDSDFTWNAGTNTLTVNQNIFPIASGYGYVGTTTTAWNTGAFDNLYCKYIYGDGSFLTGKGAIGYTHYQTIAADTWTVNHTLGTPEIIIQVNDAATPRNLLIPQNIEFTDDDTATITFPFAVAGEAICISASGASMGGASGTASHDALTNLLWSQADHTIDANIVPTASGTQDVGTQAVPFDEVNANNIRGTFYGDGSNLTGIVLSSGAFNFDIIPSSSGVYDLGSPSNTFDNVYANNVYGYNSFVTSDTGAYYFGDPSVDGTWRFIRAGNDLLAQRRETASWITKSAFLA